MKATQELQPFAPVTITLESAEELEHMCQLFMLDCTVPEAAYPRDSAKRVAMSDFMNKTYREILDNVK